MNGYKNNLARLILTVPLITVANIATSNELSSTYSGNFYHGKQSAQIYKFTGSDGQITYSTTVPAEFTQIEKITITPPPSDRHTQVTQQRHDKLKTSADELGEAREQREAIREEEEKKRLERLALINQSKPQPVYEKNLYVSYPYRLWRTYRHGGQHTPKRPVQLPAKFSTSGHRSTGMRLPSSSFPELSGR
jgi:murein DD-endopeptidase MepM/ murein hydrolase activator NlpD